MIARLAVTSARAALLSKWSTFQSIHTTPVLCGRSRSSQPDSDIKAKAGNVTKTNSRKKRIIKQTDVSITPPHPGGFLPYSTNYNGMEEEIDRVVLARSELQDQVLSLGKVDLITGPPACGKPYLSQLPTKRLEAEGKRVLQIQLGLSQSDSTPMEAVLIKKYQPSNQMPLRIFKVCTFKLPNTLTTSY